MNRREKRQLSTATSISDCSSCSELVAWSLISASLVRRTALSLVSSRLPGNLLLDVRGWEPPGSSELPRLYEGKPVRLLVGFAQSELSKPWLQRTGAHS